MIYIFLIKLIATFIFFRFLFVYGSRFLLKKANLNLPASWNLIQLAASDVLEVPVALFLFGISFWMAWSGFFVLSDIQNANSEISQYFLWLVRTDFLALFICFLGGIFLGVLFRGFGFSVGLVTALLFPFLISAPGAALIIFGDLSSSWVLKYKNQKISALFLRFLSTLVALSVFWIFGGYWREMINSFQLNPFHPFDRSIQVMILVVLLVSIDTALSLLTFHYYHQYSESI